MTPEEAGRFWEEEESRFRAEQARRAKNLSAKVPLPVGSGVRLTGESASMKASLEAMGLEVAGEGHPLVPFDRTLIWNPEAQLRLDLIPAGLRFLDRWQVAIPLWSYEELARDIGGEAERELTHSVIRDLRVPVYDHRVIFLRRCPDTARLLEVWREEHETGDDCRLCLLRSLYRVKPLLYALPTSWINQR